MIRKIRKYYVSHIWCIFATVVAVVFGAFFLWSQSYLKQQYYEYLMEKTVESEQVILNSISSNINYYTSVLIETVAEAATDHEVAELSRKSTEEGLTLSEEIKLNRLLNKYIRSSSWIAGIAISQENTLLFQASRLHDEDSIWGDDERENLNSIYETLVQKVESKEVPKMTVSAYQTNSAKSSNKRLMHISVPLIDTSGKRTEIYVVTLSIYTDFFEEYIQQIYDSFKEVVEGYVTDENDYVIYHRDKSKLGIQMEYDANTIIAMEKTLEKTRWKVHVVINLNDLLRDVNVLYKNTLFVYMMWALAIFASILSVVIWYILKPVQTIIGGMAKAQSGSFKKEIRIRGKTEVWTIATEFNKLLHSLDISKKQTMEENTAKIQALKKQQEAEWEALESQINAHFICNTIGGISFEAMEAGNHKVAVLLKKLSNILRYTFDKTNGQVYLYQEILWLDQYLFLQQMRYEGKFQYSIDIPVVYQEWKSIKLMLQPFVENSILHGFSGCTSEGMIEIIGIPGREGSLLIMIRDNGKGMDEAGKERVRQAIHAPFKRESEGMGISNVALRMKAYYGEDVDITFESSVDAGTTFVLHIPSDKQRRSL
ncbi:MAG: histidine kinase [Lachnospiraceae bacterium]